MGERGAPSLISPVNPLYYHRGNRVSESPSALELHRRFAAVHRARIAAGSGVGEAGVDAGPPLVAAPSLLRPLLPICLPACQFADALLPRIAGFRPQLRCWLVLPRRLTCRPPSDCLRDPLAAPFQIEVPLDVVAAQVLT